MTKRLPRATLAPSLVPALILLLASSPGMPSRADGPAPERIVDGVAAEVNGTPITLQEVLEAVREELARNGRDDLPDDGTLQSLYQHALDAAIRRQLVLDDFAASGGSLPEWLTDKRVSEIIDSRFDGDQARLVDDLARQGLTFSEWREEVRKNLLLTAMRHMNVDKNVRVTPAEVLAYYRAHEADYVREAGVRLRLLFLRRQDGEGDEALSKRIAVLRSRLDHEPFSEIARYFSNDASASRGGDWGWIRPEETLREELSASLAALAVGETGDPILLPGGAYILRKEGERKEGLQPIEDVRDEIETLLRRAESERLFREWTDHLRSKASVRIRRPSL